MSKRPLPALSGLLHSFFHQWLVEQRGASPRTIHSYRDAWRLFLRFVADRRKRSVPKLLLEDLSAAQVLAFLGHLEKERQSTVITRNCRLAALRSFFSFVAEQEPLAAQQCGEILHIPFKRAQRRAMTYLEPAVSVLSGPFRSGEHVRETGGC